MSAIAPARAPSRAPSRTKPQPAARPALRVVAAPKAATGPSPLPFALVVAGVLGAGLVALLMLHTLAAQDGFTLHKLQRQAATLGDVEQQLTVANQQAQAPSALAARAKALGMVPTGSLHIVRRRDGRIVAISSAVPAPPPPAPAASPSPSASASAGPGTRSTPAPAATATAKPAAAKPSAKPRRPH